MKYGEGAFSPEVLEHVENSHFCMYNAVRIVFQQKATHVIEPRYIRLHQYFRMRRQLCVHEPNDLPVELARRFVVPVTTTLCALTDCAIGL